MYVKRDENDDYQKYLDVAYEAWRSGYNPDAVNPDIVQDDIVNRNIEDVDELTRLEINRQKRKK